MYGYVGIWRNFVGISLSGSLRLEMFNRILRKSLKLGLVGT